MNLSDSTINNLTGNGSVLLGLDIGGTKTAALVVDFGLNQLSMVTRPTITSSPERLVGEVVTTVHQALADAQVVASDLAGVGIAVPGLVDPSTGVVDLAVNLNLESYPLGAELSKRLGTAVSLENDVRTAAIGAYQYFRDKERLNHLAYLSIGTGIAAGLILSGRLYRGATGMAGEIGHIIVEPQGPICGCGLAGCLEAVASGSAIARIGQLELDHFDHPITAQAVYESAAQGHVKAIEIVDRVSAYFARAIQLLIMAYDVEKVVLGGGVTRAGQTFITPVLGQLALLRKQSTLAAAMMPDEKVTLLPAGYNAGAWGAISLAMGTSVYMPA